MKIRIESLLLIRTCFANRLFRWDVPNLESVFCEHSKKAFTDLYENVLPKIEASQVLRKTSRHKWTMWPWEIADSFEGECIEETCTKSEVVEFCSRSDDNIEDKNLNNELNTQRMQRYHYCETHVEKRVNATKQISYSKREDTTSDVTDKAQVWRKELSPDRLFRGWWEELKKAYTRFCLQDESDCARKCDVDHGTCNLWEDESVAEDDKQRWKYRCECDAGYGPSYIADETKEHGEQYLCRETIDQEESGLCETLQTLNGENEKVRVTPQLLNEELGVIDQARKRKRRMVGEFSGTAKNYFFPATVDIFQSTVSLKKGATTSFSAKSTDDGVYKHQCGGTLVWANNGAEKTNQVLTAAHCFCHVLREGTQDLSELKNHFFIRIGLLDNKRALNMSTTTMPEAGTQYIDARVKTVKFADPSYIPDGHCNDASSNGKNDLAVIELARSIDFTDMDHVKPACNYALQPSHRKPHKDYMLNDNQNCYVSGWGLAEGDKGSLGISRNLKYARVTVIKPEKCKDLVPGDQFIQDMEPDKDRNYPIICALGYQEGDKSSNTCGGDSGGGLYCFDRKSKNYYLMGVLHGGNKGCTNDNVMYFSNNKHEDFKTLLSLA